MSNNINQNPEQIARDKIDQMLMLAGWVVQSKQKVNLNESKGVAVREYQTDVGPADYVLFIDRKPVGIIEAKREEEGHRLTRIFLKKTILKKLKLPFCEISLQKDVVKQIESRLSFCDKVGDSINDSLAKAQALRQSILKKAFEGKLLTASEIERCKQEVDYESASVLLERIRKEKAN